MKRRSKADKISLNFIENISGQDFEIHVSDIIKDSNSSESQTEMLKKILPSTVEEICRLGSSLNNEIKLIEIENKLIKDFELHINTFFEYVYDFNYLSLN